MPDVRLSAEGATMRVTAGRCHDTRRMGSVGALLRDERGAVTGEFTVVVPFFVFLLVFFADATILYLTHTEMYNLARDAARRMSTGELQNADEVVAYASERMFLGQRLYTVYTDFGANGNMQVLVEVPVGEAAIFGFFFTPLMGRELVALAAAGQEPAVE